MECESHCEENGRTFLPGSGSRSAQEETHEADKVIMSKIEGGEYVISLVCIQM